ncbi:substrate-binding domain-containing protein [Phytohabitans sp. ZYX-F-186]|uniref:Substrate-binding domain-containing protein n=1 Tax=Phytohabitans maris TaxID=3071409 RepID=A0ABU0Z7I7_9ACTN|nr:substrate-binding domain-containing protein [Phytohabitans sp. ZYX-F-186]MDQ7903013.1 substrate-binding domain-containing protein [Phytohabitans sp. ZYX-F-186]
MRRILALSLAALSLVAACDTPAAPQASEGPFKKGSGTLRVLAGSELHDLAPILDDVKAATGVTVELTEIGTLDGIEKVAAGTAVRDHDAIWFSNNRYLELHPEASGRIDVSTKVANSPVVLALRDSKAKELGWDQHRPTWSEIAEAAGAGRFTYGMTNPAASNSGYSALVGVAAALAGTGRALTSAEITSLTPRLQSFFAGQSLTAGSSGWLADEYVRRQAGGVPVDGLVNYESVLLSLNAGGKLKEPLTVVYPADGVVTADYPLTLLSGAAEQARTNYAAVADYLRRPSTQRKIMETTFRRPAVPGVELAKSFGPAGGGLVELPFPARYDDATALVTGFGDSLRKPARTIYVLDVSGSMKGARIKGLQTALLGLSGADSSLSGELTRFNGREQVVMLPFSTTPKTPRRFDLPADNRQPVTDQIRGYVRGLAANGDTAIYDALTRAIELAKQLDAADPNRFTSIVLLTDGERTVGPKLPAFKTYHAKLPAKIKTVPIFTLLFGEGNVTEMTELARISGGRTFDARGGSLAGVFKQIRGYQ